jgi:S1-C subfamily serine protease
LNWDKKIINDLLISGKVQRGYLGLIFKNMSATTAKELNTDITTGVYIDSIINGGAAMEADMKSKTMASKMEVLKKLGIAKVFCEILPLFVHRIPHLIIKINYLMPYFYLAH